MLLNKFNKKIYKLKIKAVQRNQYYFTETKSYRKMILIIPQSNLMAYNPPKKAKTALSNITNSSTSMMTLRRVREVLRAARKINFPKIEILMARSQSQWENFLLSITIKTQINWKLTSVNRENSRNNS